MAHHRLRSAFLAAAGALIGLCAFATTTAPAHADEVAFTFTDSRITNCSGMATDTSRNFYWTINNTEKSGGRIYGVKPNGDTTTSIQFAAPSLVDTEALAYVNGSFYVGDIGDTNASRTSVSVYRLKSPKAGATNATYTRYRLRYPDGARDAQGMWVTSSGRVYLVSKASGGIYVAPEQLSSSGTNLLKKVGTAPTNVTDATLLSDGRIAVRTSTAVSVLDGTTYKVVASSTTDAQTKGESIAPSIDGSTVLLGSAGKYSKVLSAAVPNSTTVSPSATPTVTPSTPTPSTASATPTTSSTTAPANNATSGFNPVDFLFDGQNLLWVAGGVALVAALLVFFRRR